jgi:hypothetical protein
MAPATGLKGDPTWFPLTGMLSVFELFPGLDEGAAAVPFLTCPSFGSTPDPAAILRFSVGKRTKPPAGVAAFGRSLGAMDVVLLNSWVDTAEGRTLRGGDVSRNAEGGTELDSGRFNRTSGDSTAHRWKHQLIQSSFQYFTYQEGAISGLTLTLGTRHSRLIKEHVSEVTWKISGLSSGLTFRQYPVTSRQRKKMNASATFLSFPS